MSLKRVRLTGEQRAGLARVAAWLPSPYGLRVRWSPSFDHPGSKAVAAALNLPPDVVRREVWRMMRENERVRRTRDITPTTERR